MFLLPVNSDSHHVHQGGRHVAIEEEGEDPAEGGAKSPLLVHISDNNSFSYISCTIPKTRSYFYK